MVIPRQFILGGCSWPKSILTALKQGFIKSEPEELERCDLNRVAHFLPWFSDMHCNRAFDQHSYGKNRIKVGVRGFFWPLL